MNSHHFHQQFFPIISSFFLPIFLFFLFHLTKMNNVILYAHWSKYFKSGRFITSRAFKFLNVKELSIPDLPSSWQNAGGKERRNKHHQYEYTHTLLLFNHIWAASQVSHHHCNYQSLCDDQTQHCYHRDCKHTSVRTCLLHLHESVCFFDDTEAYPTHTSGRENEAGRAALSPEGTW